MPYWPVLRSGASTMGAGPGWWENRTVNDGPHSVLVVDDQAPFRVAAKAVLRRLDCFELAAEAASGPAAIELVESIRPELC